MKNYISIIPVAFIFYTATGANALATQSIEEQVEAACRAAASYDPPDTLLMTNYLKAGRFEESKEQAEAILSYGLFGPPSNKKLCAQAVLAAIPALDADAKAKNKEIMKRG